MSIKKYAIGAAVLFAALTAVYGYGQLQYRAGTAEAKEAQYVGQLEQFKELAFEFNKAAQQMTAAAQKLESQNLEWSKRHEEIVNQNPLPDDCRAGSFRLRSYNDAIDEAATTRKLSAPLP